MFVAVTFHPNRGTWRTLFLTAAEAQADVDRFVSLFPSEPVAAHVEPATADDAAEYVHRAAEHASEAYAEWGSGAVSLGYRASDLGGHYDGYRTSGDPLFTAAEALVATLAPVAVADFAPYDDSDDIPF